MIFSFLVSAYTYFTYFLAPPFCLFCSESLHERKALCTNCSLQVLPIVPFDFYLGKEKIVKVFAVSAYKDPLRSLVLAKHANNETYIRLLADFIAGQAIVARLDFDIILFIPLHWTRYASRGFNQAEIIAQAVAQKTGKFVIPAIVRSKKTEFQARLSVEAREQNVQNAFTVDPKYAQQITGKKILLVDDLFTTGSTVKSVAQILFKFKPASVDVFVACRVTSL
ncbi:ComF family protein [Candidatus Babeliales bacterium]|nr:ComF family protein [Candidatus Babeliales bacterium]MBP9843325.1 ComF family protein [Candidatus Babeliales bacterium]